MRRGCLQESCSIADSESVLKSGRMRIRAIIILTLIFSEVIDCLAIFALVVFTSASSLQSVDDCCATHMSLSAFTVLS